MLSTRRLLLPACLSVAIALPALGARKAELPPPPAVLARVGETIVTRGDLDEILGEKLRAAKARAVEAGRHEDEVEREFERFRRLLEKQARMELLHRALVVESARSTGYEPDGVMIDWRIRSAALRAGGPEELERETGRTVEQMRNELRLKDLSTRFFVDRLPHGLMPGPDQIRAYYRAKRSRLQGPPLVKLRAIEVPAGPDRDGARYEADSLRRELQFDPSRFMMRARDLAPTEEEKARAGLVIDPATGEPVEWIPLNALPPSVGEAIKDLKPGQVSDLIEERNVFVLVKVVERREGEPVRLQDVAEDIVKALQQAQQNAMLARWSGYYLRNLYIADADGRRISAESFVGD